MPLFGYTMTGDGQVTGRGMAHGGFPVSAARAGVVATLSGDPFGSGSYDMTLLPAEHRHFGKPVLLLIGYPFRGEERVG
jgi:hypothetical protein